MKHYVVLDLEMCKVPKGARSKEYRRANEIIQIGAVLLDESYQIVGEFNSFVKPEYGRLDFYISQLTGISKDQLDRALVFEEAILGFVEWIPEGEVVMVSWSDNDSRQIAGEMKSKNVQNARLEELLQNWIDSQVIYAEKVHNDRCYSLQEALFACDIDTAGRMHDGFSDAFNTALLFKKLMTEDEFISCNIDLRAVV